LAGSPAFRETVGQLHRLLVGHNQAMGQVNDFWREKKLPDDLPAICFANTEALDDEAMNKYLNEVLEGKTDRWSTHPSDRDRIRHAEKMEAPGVLHSDLPATALLNGFDEMSRKVTESFYRFEMGDALDPKFLWSTSKLMESQKLEADRNQGLGRFLQGVIEKDAIFFPRPSGEPLAVDRSVLVDELVKVRKDLLAAREDTADTRNALANRRLEIDLHLLGLPEMELVRDEIQDGGARVETLTAVMDCLRRIFPSNVELEKTFKTALRELEVWQADQQSKVKRHAFDESFRDLQAIYLKMREELDAVPYPFTHSDGEITCAEYAAKAKPEIEEIGPLFNAASILLQHMGPLYVKTLARLIEVAEKVEDASGLERLEAPAIRDVEEEKEAGGN
jgi:hypothetical protein